MFFEHQRGTRAFGLGDEAQKILFKVNIRDFYISSMNVLIDSKKKVEDIFEEIQKYEPSINHTNFQARESIMGDVDDESSMRNLNLQMPLDLLKTHTIYLAQKKFYDEIRSR